VATYPTLRKMRPDGNCFFRAFSFAILESLVGRQDALKEFREKVLESKSLLNDAGFNQFTVDDFYDTFLEIVDKVGAGITIEDLEREFQEPSLADYLVVYLRIVTSAELRKNAEFYQNFIEEKTVEEFCQLEVEPMYKESDHIHIIGLTKSLGVAVRVVYMDRGKFLRSCKFVIVIL
jgi:ubiquitin thioesterase protein OTUB1